MTQQTPTPLVPGPEDPTLANLLTSVGTQVLTSYGQTSPWTDRLSLPQAHRYVVVLVDGMGWVNLNEHRARAPYLSSLLDRGRQITCAIPSTTAASLTSLGTGLLPSAHGTVGYCFRHQGHPLNALSWRDDVDPLAYQPHPTTFQTLNDNGIHTASVTLAHFENSGLTLSGLRGPAFVGLDDEDDDAARIAAIVEQATRGDASLIYAYERRLDHTGHEFGCTSQEWRTMLDQIDTWLEGLRIALPDDIRLVVTADHGMTDVFPDHFIMAEDDARLVTDVTMISGEPRFRHVYTDDPRAVAKRWAEVMGERAIVRTRDEAIEAGWFAPTSEDIAERLGDVMVAMMSDWVVMRHSHPGELTLIGEHGSLTPQEMQIPVLID